MGTVSIIHVPQPPSGVVGKGQARAQAVLLYTLPLCLPSKRCGMCWGFSTTKSSDSYIKEMERVFEIEGDFHFLFLYSRQCRTSSVPWGPQWKSIFSASMGVSSVYGGCRQNGRKGGPCRPHGVGTAGKHCQAYFSFFFHLSRPGLFQSAFT